MSEQCEMELQRWGRHQQYACDRCDIHTLSEQVYLSRCELNAPARPLESAAGLLGPSGDPLPKPQPSPEPSAHDAPRPVGGGWYATADGQRVQGYDKAVAAQEAATHDR